MRKASKPRSINLHKPKGMPGKKRDSLYGIVFSTDPDFATTPESPEIVTPLPAQQKLKVRMENKHRGGKTATIVTGFVGKAEDMESLSRQLKAHCGTGGSAKDGEIIIQGDQRAKITTYLQKLGYRI